MNTQDIQTCTFAGVGKLDFTIDSTRPQQGRVKNINAVGRHEHLDILAGLETVQLVEQLEHGALHFTVSTATALHTRATDAVDLVHKNNRRCMLTSHYEEFTHHAASLSDVLLHQLTARHTDEGTLGVVSNGAGQQGLAGAGRTIQEHTLRLSNAQTFEEFWMLDGQFDHLLNLANLLAEATDHFVGAIRHLLDAHQGHQRIDLVGQNLVQHVVVVAQCDARVGSNLRRWNLLAEIHHKLAFWMHLHQHLVLAHQLDHLAHVRARLLQLHQLLTQCTNLRIQFVSLRLKTLHIFGLLITSHQQLIDLGLVVRADSTALCRGGGGRGGVLVIRRQGRCLWWYWWHDVIFFGIEFAIAGQRSAIIRLGKVAERRVSGLVLSSG
mmetsp:Transcript_2801/g.8771  ORF Transcript_2801/g.8771 Transcript_2801/m.8771 type:complete len:381 (+) Transcript_2801:309-1451(+)